MKQHHYTIHTGQELLFVEVLEEVHNIITDACNSLLFMSGDDKYDYDLPQGNWQLLGLASEMSEENCIMIVPELESVGSTKVFTDFENGGKITNKNGIKNEVLGFDTAKTSFNSLLTSLGFKPEGTVVLKKTRKWIKYITTQVLLHFGLSSSGLRVSFYTAWSL